MYVYRAYVCTYVYTYVRTCVMRQYCGGILHLEMINYYYDSGPNSSVVGACPVVPAGMDGPVVETMY